jgi:NADPH:quinone reductase-like Zn-dependent oxidoreductase
MKAVAYFQYGGPEVMRLVDLPQPVVQPGFAVVKVAAASINPVDWKLRSGMMRLLMGKKFPRVMGADLAGVIHAIDGTTELKPGDQVYGFAPPTQPSGSLAEFCLVRLDRLAKLPQNLSLNEAAALPCVGVTAYTSLIDKGRLRAGQRALIHGCTGGIGHVAVQIAKAHGAHVTGTCRTSSIPFAQSLGVDEIIDYTQQDILRTSQRFDLIVETSGTLSFRKAKAIMTERSRFLDPTLHVQNILLGLGGKHYHPIIADIRRPALDQLTKMVESGALKPIAGLTVALGDAIATITDIEHGKSVQGKAVIVL